MGKYNDVSLIGSGGFGDVWRCEREDDSGLFAKKVLREDADGETSKRFIREVRITKSLVHPNIIRIIDVRLGETPYFYIMPLYEKSLRDELPSMVGNAPRVFKVFGAILNAMEYAHEQGVLHRDLKPENILMNSDTDVVVSDFGLGRIVDAQSTRQTVTGFPMGTFFYMAPEQLIDAKRASERADIFSMGRILYELYTGPLLSTVQDTSKLPPGIASIVNRCTNNEPDGRFRSVTDLKNAWQSFFDSSLRESERDELISLKGELTAPASITEDRLSRLLELLDRHQGDSDLLHEVLMQIDPDIIAAIYEKDPMTTCRILKHFLEFTQSHRWSFSYTDSIGNRCRSLFDIIPDQTIKAMLIGCTLEVGAGHHRFHVLGIFGELMLSQGDPGFEAVLRDYLENVDGWKRELGAKYLDLTKLNQGLRDLFEFTRLDEEHLPF